MDVLVMLGALPIIVKVLVALAVGASVGEMLHRIQNSGTHGGHDATCHEETWNEAA